MPEIGLFAKKKFVLVTSTKNWYNDFGHALPRPHLLNNVTMR